MKPRRLAVLLGACALFTTAASAQTALTVPPYLHNVDHDSAVVGLRVASSCPVTVHYGPPGGAMNQVESPDATHHLVRLEGLQPATQYQYTVSACGQETGKGGTLTTAPGQRTGSVTFGVAGDFGTGGSQQTAVTERMVQRLPAFWATVGDNAYQSGTDQEFVTRMFVPMAELLASSPVFPTLGNHDYVSDQGGPYLALFELPTNPKGGERYYSFDWGPVHVVALDSHCAAGHATTCTVDEQQAFMEQSFANTDRPWKVVVMHHPPYSSGKYGSNDKIQRWVPTFEAAGVDVVFAGHEHSYERTHPMKGGQKVAPGTPGAVSYVIIGSGGATLRDFGESQPEWSAHRDNQNYGYVEVQIDGGTLTSRFLNPQGNVVDEFTLTKEVPPLPNEPDQPGNGGGALDVTVAPPTGQAPLAVTLFAGPEANDDVVWNLGDGNFASGATVTHTYAEPGQYTATASLPGSDGAKEASAQVSVLDERGQPGAVVEPPPMDGTGPGGPGGGCASAGMGLGLTAGPLFGVWLWARRRSGQAAPQVVQASSRRCDVHPTTDGDVG